MDIPSIFNRHFKPEAVLIACGLQLHDGRWTAAPGNMPAQYRAWLEINPDGDTCTAHRYWGLCWEWDSEACAVKPNPRVTAWDLWRHFRAGGNTGKAARLAMKLPELRDAIAKHCGGLANV